MIEIAKCEQNEFQDDELVCYCFEYTRSDIEKDYMKNGRSTIMEKIVSEKKQEDVIVLRNILKDVDVWLTSARWWTGLQEDNLFEQYNMIRCLYAHHGYHW